MNLNPAGDYPPSVRQACPFQFRLRSLFVVMTLVAVLAIPVHGWVTSCMESLRQPAPAPLPSIGFTTIKTNVQVPDGGKLSLGGAIQRDSLPRFERNKQLAAAAPKHAGIPPAAISR